MNKIMLVLISLFCISNIYGQDKITVTGNISSGSNIIQKADLKNIIAYFKGDIVFYGTNLGNNFVITISKEQSTKLGIGEKIPFVIVNDAVPYYILANYNQPEIPKTGTWTLTKFPNSDIYYVDKVENTPYANLNKETYKRSYANMKNIEESFKSGDESFAMKFFRNQTQRSIKYSMHRFYFLNLLPYCVEMTESKYEADPILQYKTTPDKLSDLAKQYLEFLTTGFNNDINVYGLSKEQWNIWWGNIINQEAFPVHTKTKYQLNEYKSIKYVTTDLKFINDKIYFNTGTAILNTDLKENKINQLTNNNINIADFSVANETISVFGKGFPINNKTKYAKYSLNEPINELISPIEVRGTDSIGGAPIKISHFNNTDVLIYFRKGKLFIKSVNSTGEINDILNDFIPKFYESVSSTNESGNRIITKQKINPRRITNSKLKSISVLSENSKLTLFYALESNYFTKAAENMNIKTLHILTLDPNYNVIKDIQVNNINKEDWRNNYDQLNISRSQNYYLLSWLFQENGKQPTLRSIVTNSELKNFTNQKIISETKKLYGVSANNDNFYLIFLDDINSYSNIKIAEIDKYNAIRRTFNIKLNKPTWILANSLSNNKLHIYNVNKFTLEERIISLK